MNFTGPARPRTDRGITEAAAICGCHVAAIKAVIDVESAGDGFENGRPLIRWERHKAIKLARDRNNAAAVAGFKRLPKANSGDQGARYELLARAMRVDATIALEAHSWGCMQVMGFNYAQAGFPSVVAFVNAMCQGEDEQIIAAARWIKANRIDDELRRGDFDGFARVYNGPGYAKNNYATDMAEYFRQFGGTAWERDAVTLSVGASGPRVKHLQEELGRLGYYVKPDGDFGPDTRRQVLAFQAQHNLETDGRVGPKTMAAMEAAQPLDVEKPGFVDTLKNSTVAQTAAGGVVTGAGTVAGKVAEQSSDAPDLSVAIDKVTDLGDKAREVGYAVDGYTALWQFVSSNWVFALGVVIACLCGYILWRNFDDIKIGKKRI